MTVLADLLRRAPAPVKRVLTRIARKARKPKTKRERRAAQVLLDALPSGPSGLPEGVLDCVVAFNQHGAYCVPRSAAHRPSARTVLVGKVWEDRTIALVNGVDGNIVHAGTFFGDFLPALARSRPQSTVWAFEPNEESYRCAAMTVMLNGLTNVRLLHAGLDARSGDGLLRTVSDAGRPLGGASRLTTAVEGLGERVSLVSIDEAVTDPVSVIQLDVEGYEQSALTGALDTLRRRRPLLILESLPDSDWMQANLAPLGYRRKGYVDGNHVLRA